MRTLKHSENNLASIADKMSLNLEVNTKMGGYHNTQKFYSENVLKALKEYQLKNSVPNAMKDKERYIDSHSEWYTLEELSSFTGIGKDRLNQLLPEFCNQLQNSFKLGGYHNTQKFYSEKVLKALKEYQIKNGVSNATKNKDVAVSGNVSFIENQTVGNTIDYLLNNPDTIRLLLQKSLEKNNSLSLENKRLNEIVAEQKPKVDYFDSYMDASNLSEIGQLGKVTKIGERNIFKVMVADGYIRGKCVDGIFYYVPNYSYERYFETIPVPFMKQGKQLSRDKLMLTKEGFVYFMKKYKSN